MYRALIVAANNYDRERYKRILQELDIEIMDKCRTAAEALQVFRVSKPEIVVLDLLIPVTSGIDLLRSMKNDNETTSIVFLTPIDTRAIIERAFRLRAEDVLVKPFSDAEFASTMLHIMQYAAERSNSIKLS